MTSIRNNLILIGVLAATLYACGGGGGGSATTAAVTTAETQPPESEPAEIAQRSLGVITRFGSIYVNGVEYDTSEAEIIIEGEPATEQELGVGMVVFVDGEVNEDGVTGTAVRVFADDEIEGPVSAIETAADGDSKQLTILGFDVIVERGATVFEDTTFDTIAVNDVVEVSGFPETGNNLRATRVEKKADFVAGETEIEIDGLVASLGATTFSLGDFTVDYETADLSQVEGALADGMAVEVYGTLVDSIITATRIESEDDISDRVEVDDEFEIEGTVTAFNSLADFVVNGVSVNAEAATFKPATLTIANGSIVEVEGVWDGSVLTASKVELRRGRIEVTATVEAVDVEGNTLTLTVGTSSVVVTVTGNTLFDDDSDVIGRLTLSDINVGDFLEVEAYEDNGALIATRIDRENDDEVDDFEVKGAVQGFTEGVDLTILDTTYNVSTATFETDKNGIVDSQTFFAALAIGDVVEIKVLSNAPTTAIEVELEQDDRPDGGLEFDDDGEDDESDEEEDEDSADEADEADEESDEEEDD